MLVLFKAVDGRKGDGGHEDACQDVRHLAIEGIEQRDDGYGRRDDPGDVDAHDGRHGPGHDDLDAFVPVDAGGEQNPHAAHCGQGALADDGQDERRHPEQDGQEYLRKDAQNAGDAALDAEVPGPGEDVALLEAPRKPGSDARCPRLQLLQEPFALEQVAVDGHVPDLVDEDIDGFHKDQAHNLLNREPRARAGHGRAEFLGGGRLGLQHLPPRGLVPVSGVLAVDHDILPLDLVMQEVRIVRVHRRFMLGHVLQKVGVPLGPVEGLVRVYQVLADVHGLDELVGVGSRPEQDAVEIFVFRDDVLDVGLARIEQVGRVVAVIDEEHLLLGVVPLPVHGLEILAGVKVVLLAELRVVHGEVVELPFEAGVQANHDRGKAEGRHRPLQRLPFAGVENFIHARHGRGHALSDVVDDLFRRLVYLERLPEYARQLPGRRAEIVVHPGEARSQARRFPLFLLATDRCAITGNIRRYRYRRSVRPDLFVCDCRLHLAIGGFLPFHKAGNFRKIHKGLSPCARMARKTARAGFTRQE